MRTTITTTVDCELKTKAMPILKNRGLSLGVLMDETLERYIKKYKQEEITG